MSENEIGNFTSASELTELVEFDGGLFSECCDARVDPDFPFCPVCKDNV